MIICTPYYETGLDAVIVQDMGVMEFIKTHFPNLPIHTSTQMTITNVDGAKTLKGTGRRACGDSEKCPWKKFKESMMK